MVFQSIAGSSIRAWKGPTMRQEGHKENWHTSEIPRESQSNTHVTPKQTE